MRVPVSDLIGESHDLGDVEMVDDEGNAVTAQRGDELGGLLDRFRSIVVGLQRTSSAAAAATEHRGPGFTQRGGDSTTSSARRPGNHGDAAT